MSHHDHPDEHSLHLSSSGRKKKAGSDRDEKNPAKKRQEKKKRVEKPGPHTIDQSQDDVADPESPFSEPRGN